MRTGELKDVARVPQLWPVLAACLLLPAGLHATTASMVRVWLSNETFTHGFLILPIALWLAWQQRAELARLPLQRDARALLLLLPAVGLWLLAQAVDVAVVAQLALVALVPLTLWFAAGPTLTWALAFPLAYLLFAVPLGQSLIPPMMEFTAGFTVRLIELSGIPIYRDGLSFSLPSGDWSVVEECSGVRYLIASAALGTLYAYLSYRSLIKRTVFIVVSLLVPVVANGLRAYGIVMIGHLSGMRLAVGVDHLLYGWLFFGLVIFVMFWIGGFWADSGRGAGPTLKAGEKAPEAAGAGSAQAGTALRRIALVAALLLALETLLQAGTGSVAGPDTLAPPEVAGSSGEALEEDAWRPILHNPDARLHRRYGTGDDTVSLHVGWYGRQRDGAEAVSSLNRITDPYEGDWKLIAERLLDPGDGRVREAEIRLGERRQLVWLSYRLGDREEGNAYLAKVWQALGVLSGRRDGAVIVLATSLDDQRLEEARQRLARFRTTAREPIARAFAAQRAAANAVNPS